MKSFFAKKINSRANCHKNLKITGKTIFAGKWESADSCVTCVMYYTINYEEKKMYQLISI